MTLAGIARDSVLSPFDVPQRRLPRDRAATLLAAIESVQQKTDLGQLTEPKLGGSTTAAGILREADRGAGFGGHAGI